MIIFKGTKTIGIQSYIEFSNEKGSVIQIPVETNLLSRFLLYFDRLELGTKPLVETQTPSNK
jgi:hypothetical protein